jgi:hypothetical protein
LGVIRRDDLLSEWAVARQSTESHPIAKGPPQAYSHRSRSPRGSGYP